MFRISLFIIAFVSIVASCSDKKNITLAKEYDSYLKEGVVATQLKTVETEIEFWNERLQKDTGNFVDMLELANNYLKIFRLSGNVTALKTGDSLLKKSSGKLNDAKPEILYSLAQTAVTQHQFINAEKYVSASEKADGDLFTINLLQFDVNMELGKYNDARKNLELFQDKLSFDYLIRKAKWADHNGDLDEAIQLMEIAFQKVKDRKKSLFVWTLSNLGDMYGHAGRVEDAYSAYLEVLKKDPSNLYCLKGIAWIAYSHDNNTKEAKRILNYILSQTNMPELKLVLAQIAESEGDEIAKEKLLNEFVSLVSDPAYGNMYSKYLIEIFAEEFNEQEKAITIASNELNNRFTPETCDWMAWSYYNTGDYAKAMEFSNSYVYKQTFEPGATMHTAFIFAANGKKEEARKLLKDCLESSFELGVIATKQIKEKLASL